MRFSGTEGMPYISRKGTVEETKRGGSPRKPQEVCPDRKPSLIHCYSEPGNKEQEEKQGSFLYSLSLCKYSSMNQVGVLTERQSFRLHERWEILTLIKFDFLIPKISALSIWMLLERMTASA